MSFSATLLIDGIQGESVVADHADEIDVVGLNWGAKQESTGHIGAGGGAGKVNIQDLTFVKYVDKATPKLFLHCATGKDIKKATLTMRKAGGEALDYYSIVMEDVLVTGFDTNAELNQETAQVQEVVSLKFKVVELKYKPQDGQNVSIDAKFDIARNIA